MFIFSYLEARKRVLSNTKEKLEYFSRCPSPIKNLIKGHKGNIKVSEIHSKKLFMLCSKIVNKANVKLPKVYSPLVQNQDESLSDSSSDESYKWKVLSPKHHQVERNLYNSDKALDVDQSPFSPYSDPNSDLSSFASSRRLDKEECESSYKLVNSKIRERVSKALASRHFLFTFDPSKWRIRSPIAQRQRLL